MPVLKKTIEVVGAAIIDGGKILVAQRPHSQKTYKSLKWEFPGGKIEIGENVETAVKREIHEELGCQVEVVDILPEIEHEYPDFILKMALCICHISGSTEPRCLEHNAIIWASPADLESLDWAAADARCYPAVIHYVVDN